MITVRAPYRPLLYRPSLGGPLLAGSGRSWIEVPEGTTVDQLEWVQDDPLPTVPREQTMVLETNVRSSKGDDYYHVTLEIKKSDYSLVSGSCQCYGYFYRHQCRHIKYALEQAWTTLKRTNSTGRN